MVLKNHGSSKTPKVLVVFMDKLDAIATVAPVGIAAVLIDGENVHLKSLINSRSI